MINIFVVMLTLLFVLCGYCCGKFLSGYFGVTGWVAGFAGGTLCAVLLYYGIMRVLQRRDAVRRRERRRTRVTEEDK
jgi:hypothetical protein